MKPSVSRAIRLHPIALTSIVALVAIAAPCAPKGADSSTVLEWKAAPGTKPLAIAAWLVVGIPLAWGVWVTLQKTAVLFH